MRGRTKFATVRPLLLSIAAGLRLLPRPLVEGLWRWTDGVPGLLGIGLRYSIAAGLAKRLGDSVLIAEYVEVRGWEQFECGSNVSIQRGCYIDASGGLTVGDDVSVAHGCSILSFEHTWLEPDKTIRDNPLRLDPVVIERDVWIGCGVRVLAGGWISTRSIVAAGSVVKGRHPPGSVLAGAPARVVRTVAFEEVVR